MGRPLTMSNWNRTFAVVAAALTLAAVQPTAPTLRRAARRRDDHSLGGPCRPPTARTSNWVRLGLTAARCTPPSPDHAVAESGPPSGVMQPSRLQTARATA